MKQYLIINISEINLVDFETIAQTSTATLRKSIDGQKRVIKWFGEKPNWVDDLSTKEGPYSESEILTIMTNPIWAFVDGGES
jgi:hypothetical protein